MKNKWQSSETSDKFIKKNDTKKSQTNEKEMTKSNKLVKKCHKLEKKCHNPVSTQRPVDSR